MNDVSTRIELTKSSFTNQGLVVESAGYFKGPRLFQDGALGDLAARHHQ
jgi:hypothetical protein